MDRHVHAIDCRLTRRCLLWASGGMALMLGSGPGIAQRLVVNEVTERRESMDIKRNGSRPSAKGPEAYFTGAVRVDPVFQVGDPMRLNAGSVTFEPGARTAWHTHPLGQTLIITAGSRPRADRSKKSGPGTWCGFHPVRGTGTVQRRPQR